MTVEAVDRLKRDAEALLDAGRTVVREYGGAGRCQQGHVDEPVFRILYIIIKGHIQPLHHNGVETYIGLL